MTFKGHFFYNNNSIINKSITVYSIYSWRQNYIYYDYVAYSSKFTLPKNKQCICNFPQNPKYKEHFPKFLTKEPIFHNVENQSKQTY